MTSRKQKKSTLKIVRSTEQGKMLYGIDTRNGTTVPPPGAVMADQTELSRNSTYDVLPRFHTDKVLICRAYSK
jgi:hypothetical protein